MTRDRFEAIYHSMMHAGEVDSVGESQNWAIHESSHY